MSIAPVLRSGDLCPLRYFATDFEPNLREHCSKNVYKTFTTVQLIVNIALEIASH